MTSHGTHKHTINSTKFIQLYLLTPLLLLHINYQQKDEILYNQLCIGHTRLTYCYLIEHTDPPKCTSCNQLLSIKCILTECTSYGQTQL